MGFEHARDRACGARFRIQRKRAAAAERAIQGNS